MSFVRRLGGALGVSIAFACRVAAAQEPPPKPFIPQEEKPSNEKPVAPPPPATAPSGPRITVHAYEENASQTTVDAVEAAAGDQLSSDARFQFKRFHELLEPSEDIPRLLGEADIAVVDADSAFGEMDLDKAKTLLAKAIETYTAHLPELGARGGGTASLRDAYIRLAKTKFFDGDNDGARDALRYVFVLDSAVEFSPKTFPPQMKKTVVEAKLLYETLGNGKLQLDSDPQGADVWLNGTKLLRTTPTEIEAPPGPNFVTFAHRGYKTTTIKLEVNGGGDTQQIVQALERPTGGVLQGINRARLHLDEPKLPPQLREAAKALNQDMLLLFRFNRHEEADGSVSTELQAFLYDQRPDRVIKKATQKVPEPRAPDAARALTKEVTTGIRLDGVWVPPPVPKRPSRVSLFFKGMGEKMHAFRQSPSFWYVVGGVAGVVVVAAAVGIGVGVEQHQQAQRAVVLFGGN